MRKPPQIVHADDLQRDRTGARIDGGWHAARSIPYQQGTFSLRIRLKLAWLVFTGQADALKWYEQ
jgi:hypothetical protein